MDSERMFKLKRELNEFLEQHPELRTMQAEIDKALAKAGNANNRMSVLHGMMMDKVRELKDALNGVKESAEKAIEMIKPE